MYPNPQEALPLPLRPDVEQYKKLAKELTKACKSSDPSAIDAWTAEWITALGRLQHDTRWKPGDDAAQVARFARERFEITRTQGSPCGLTTAQFVIARAHGFLSWPRFAKHLELLALDRSPVSSFEAAAHAIVTGDLPALEQRLHDDPTLVHTRSTREHGATLLHYVSANGVEGFRQISPQNVPGSARLLLQTGAEVDARAEVYGSGCTTLGLVATSGPPAVAGVQLPLIDVLLEFDARMDLEGMAGHDHSLVHACLANGQPAAADYVASRGAPLDLIGAAGLGRVDVIKVLVQESDRARTGTATPKIAEAFALACMYGRVEVVEYLLDWGLDVDTELNAHGSGHTALHVGAFYGNRELVDLVIARGASVHVIDKTWGTTPLSWALTGWDRADAEDAPAYYDIVTRLLAAGADVVPRQLEWDKVRADPKMLSILERGARRSS